MQIYALIFFVHNFPLIYSKLEPLDTSNGAGIFGEALNECGGVYNANHTLFYRDSPYRASKNMQIRRGATLNVEQGVRIYFDPGIGIDVMGVLNVAGDYLTRVKFLPTKFPKEDEHEHGNFPHIRLVDGPSTRQGRLQIFHKNKWRAVCTMNTNWTDIDYSVACKSMGFGGGNFWRFFRRNNDTYPFVMPKPGCPDYARNLEQCANFSTNLFMLAENLCQGEDDLGLMCYGPATFMVKVSDLRKDYGMIDCFFWQGWKFHWKGIRFFDAPWTIINDDPDDVSVKKRSLSSLQHLDIYYAGFDNETMNSTSSIYVQGVPPFINFVNVKYGAGDGLRILDSSAPIEIANSSFSFNRGHGIVAGNTTDGRLFINETRIEFNYGDGIQYEPKNGLKFYSPKANIPHANFIPHAIDKPEIDACEKHQLVTRHFPHIVEFSLKNGTSLEVSMPCHVGVQLPENRLSYSYMIQFLEVSVARITSSKSFVYICVEALEDRLHSYLYKIPIFDGIMPPSIEAKNTINGLHIVMTCENCSQNIVPADIRVILKISAGVQDHLPYSLNISNSVVRENVGHGLLVKNSRDKIIVNNVTVANNQHIGLHVSGGVSDLWINNSVIEGNFNDGINISYIGGSTVINGSSISNNRLRGAAFHYNDSGPFLPLRQNIIIKGRPAIGPDYKNTNFNYNSWGGLLIGNFCVNAYNRVDDPKVILSFVNFIGNEYHPAFEYHSCRRDDQPMTLVEISGSICRKSTGFCFRIQPAVNIRLHISDNNFAHNSRGVMVIRNDDHPELSHLPADVHVIRNQFKFNAGNFILHVGLNNHSPVQKALISDQNEIRENKIQNPYPRLTPRNFPYAAVVVSSSNVKLTRNCFNNVDAEYELATDLAEHGDTIEAGENNFGSYDFDRFMPKIFDHFKRFTLASINVDPVAAICNSQNPRLTPMFNYFRKFRQYSNPYVLGGTIYEPTDLPKGTYTVVDDLHIVPGATLTLQAGTVFKFADSIGLLVQGEMIRQRDGFSSEENSEPIVFTRLETKPPKEETPPTVRLVHEDPDLSKSAIVGRLEVLLDGEWGVVCNRSWTPNLAALVCNQLGAILDREYYEKWAHFLPRNSTDLPILMDIIRCEEWENEITKCRHDGVEHNINLTCTDIVGVRCVEPHWAGVRYSLLANPPTVTGQSTIRNLIIEKAGLLDAYTPQFCSALQIDWNFHIFQDLIIRDNWWTGVDIIYNDFMRKPRFYNSLVTKNRRHGMRLRSVGISMENVTLSNNDNAGLLYDPVVPVDLQRDVYSWLKNPPMQTFSNIFVIGDDREKSVTHEITLTSSVRDRRKFVIIKNFDFDVRSPDKRSIHFNLRIMSKNLQTGLGAKIGVQLVGRPNNGRNSDENMIFIDSNRRTIDLKKSVIDFPFVSAYDTLTIEYTRSYGKSTLAILLFYMDAYEMIDPFVHLRHSSISGNEYGVLAVHYSTLEFPDGSIVNRHRREQLWFQKSNFTRNKRSIFWVQTPSREKSINIISKIEYFIDNCSITLNNGGILQSHRDLYASTNIFFWKIYRSNFLRNENLAVHITLANPMHFAGNHTVVVTENEFKDNLGFEVKLSGFYTWMNFSSNNFTSNQANFDKGLLIIRGMEKEMIMERNRFAYNKCKFILKYDIRSQFKGNIDVQSRIWFNYLEQNYFLTNNQPKIENYPRSYALGIFGVQKVNISYNNIYNPLFDFELVSGLSDINPVTDRLNATFNYWGPSTRGDLAHKIFDFDDWNIFSPADYSPYFVTREKSLHFEWRQQYAQTDNVPYNEPNADDLKGRLFTSMILTRRRSQWPNYPWHYKPDIPYRIRKDLTIMPGAVLTIEKGVEVHLCPNVRILVLGSLVAQGTLDEPIRFKPINVTEYDHFCSWHRASDHSKARVKKRDTVDVRFPLLNRYVSSLHNFTSHLLPDGSDDKQSGFLHIFNLTTGEMVPICDRQFSTRNAEVVCRELGFGTKNTYFWIGPRYSWNPKLRIIKTYAEPRVCTGEESRLSDCDLRFTGQPHTWQCVDVEHFVFIHCSPARNYLHQNYVGHWGGLFFSTSTFETSPKEAPKSFLSNVEIVGAGFAHNESCGSLTTVYHSLILENVNVTNSSMHGIQVLSPKDTVELVKLNVTYNKGVGLDVLTTNFPVSEANAGKNERSNIFLESTSHFANFPHHIFGFLHMCSPQKIVNVQFRSIIFYKYDNFAVDCVKFFASYSPTKQIQFKVLKIWLFNVDDDDRVDSLTFYDGTKMAENKKLAYVQHRTSVYENSALYHRDESLFYFPREETNAHVYILGGSSRNLQVSVKVCWRSIQPANSPNMLAYWNRKDAKVGKAVQSRTGTLGVHFTANAADGSFGFFAEVSVVPAPMESRPVRQVRVKECRFENNDRGAIRYASLGENGPDLSIESSFFKNNGYRVWSNFSTSRYALDLDLQNTQNFAIKFCSFWRNQGGLNLKITGSSSHRSKGIVKNCAIGNNENSEIFKAAGDVYHKIYILNNYFGKNNAPYHDLIDIDKIIANFTRNIFYNNTGSHILHSEDRRSTAHEFLTYLNNFFHENIAFGHGYRHEIFDFGYLPQNPNPYVFSAGGRRKRQSDSKTNFDWLANVGSETERYRSTLLVGGTQHYFYNNFFNNPQNSFELTTVNKSSLDVYDGPIDAKSNYWGYPGTAAIAQGRIRDEEDYAYLLKVDYEPVLESNTTLMEGFCPPGWFQVGFEEWKSFQSCYMFVPGVMSFHNAIQFCKISTDILIWMSGTDIPSWMCAALSTRTKNVEYHSCELMLPFVCEKGPGLYEESLVLQPAGLAALVIALILLAFIVLLICLWYMKSNRRKKEFFERKNSLRSSMRSNRLMILEKAKKQKENEEKKNNYNNFTDSVNVTPIAKRAESPDLVSQAYRNLVMGKNCETPSYKGSPQYQPYFGKTKKQNSPSQESACTQSTAVCCSSSSITTSTCESVTPRKQKTQAVYCSRRNLSQKFGGENCSDSPTTSICNLIDNNYMNVNSAAIKKINKQENLSLVSFRKPAKPPASSSNSQNESCRSSARCSDCHDDQYCSSCLSANNSARSSTVTVDSYCNYCKRPSSSTLTSSCCSDEQRTSTTSSSCLYCSHSDDKKLIFAPSSSKFDGGGKTKIATNQITRTKNRTLNDWSTPHLSSFSRETSTMMNSTIGKIPDGHDKPLETAM